MLGGTDLRFAQVEFQQFWEFWKSMRHKKVVPSKKDFRPEKIPHLIKYMTLCSWDEGGRLRLRVMARNMAEKTGIWDPGEDLLKKMHPDVRNGFGKHLKSIFNHPAGLIHISQIRALCGQIFQFQHLILPLSCEPQEDNFMLVCSLAHEGAQAEYDGDHPDHIMLGVKDIRLLDIGAGLPHITFPKNLSCKNTSL
tara:strand:+ start:5767 stop:6351 length:585 start_codon:yes stop_codon:yes gene_type:complete